MALDASSGPFHVNPEQAREGARTIRAAFGRFSNDYDAILRVLNQHPQIVRAVREVYDAEFSVTGQGLLADFAKQLGPPYAEVILALLTRAGIATDQICATYIEQRSTQARSRGHHAIVANPVVKVAVPGAVIRYSLAKDAERDSEDSYYTYQWMALNDPQTSQARGMPELVWGPKDASAWSPRWGFPGHHKILCRLQLHTKRAGIYGSYVEHPPEYLEYQQTVHEQGEVLAGAMDKVPRRESPADQLRLLQAYQQAIADAEQQKGSDQADPKTKEALATQAAKLQEKLKGSEGHARYPVKAVHVASESAQVTPLNVFVYRSGFAAGHETWVLVDITNPADRRLTGEYEGTGPDSRSAIRNAIAAWDHSNRYPKGRLRIKVPPETGAAIDEEFQTDGMSFWDSIAEFLSQVGLCAGLGMLGTAFAATVVPEPAVSKSAAVLLWTSILAGTAGASVAMIQRHVEGMATVKEDAFDALTIVGNILGARWALGATVKGLSLAGSPMSTALAIGRFGTDAAQGILLSVEYLTEYQQILADSDPKRRTDRLIQLLGKAALSGGLLLLSMRGNKADLEQLNAQKANLGKLGIQGDTIDLAVAATDGRALPKPLHDAQTSNSSQLEVTSHSEPQQSHQPAEEPRTSPSKGAHPPRVTDPVPGLFDSVDITPNTAPPGWIFRDEMSHLPGAIRIRTRVMGPDGSTGHLLRTYDSKKHALIMEVAFLDKLPSWIEAGIPLRPGSGTPTVTYLTLRQMKMAGVQFANLKSVKMSTIQNIEAIMQLKHFTDQGLSLDEAVRRTHSVQYATTSIQQSGHTIVDVRLDITGETWHEEIGKLMEHYETSGHLFPPDPKIVAEHEKLLKIYHMERSDRMLSNYDIHIDLAPHPNNPN